MAYLTQRRLWCSPILLQPLHLLQQRQRPSFSQEVVDHNMTVPLQFADSFGGELVAEAIEAPLERLMIFLVELWFSHAEAQQPERIQVLPTRNQHNCKDSGKGGKQKVARVAGAEGRRRPDRQGVPSIPTTHRRPALICIRDADSLGITRSWNSIRWIIVSGHRERCHGSREGR